MRILILTFYYSPDLSAGSFRTTALVKELKNIINKNDKIEIITTQPNRYNTFSKEAKSFEQYADNIEINRISLGSHKSGFVDQSKLFIKFTIQVFKIIQKKEKYDIVYATSSRLMTAFLGAMVSNKQNAKLFLDIRDIFIDTLQSIFAKNKLRYIIPVFKQIEKYTINSADHINLVSKGFENYFRNINNKIPYSFYTNGIDDIFLNYNFNNSKSNNKQIITYAGNIGEGQGLEKIVPDMAKKLGNGYEIHIFGDGGKKKNLREKIQGVKNVKLFSPVNRENLLEIYKNSDILFLHLNNYNAFKKVLPSKIFEYAATNKFIIAGVDGYAKEFIKNNICNAIVFKPCNADDFYNQFINNKINFNINRKDFINKFSRKKIMNNLSKEIVKL